MNLLSEAPAEKRAKTIAENRTLKIDVFHWPHPIRCNECGVTAFAIDAEAHTPGCQTAKWLRAGTIGGRLLAESANL